MAAQFDSPLKQQAGSGKYLALYPEHGHGDPKKTTVVQIMTNVQLGPP